MEVHDELSVFGWMLKTALESWTLVSHVSIDWVDDGACVYHISPFQEQPAVVIYIYISLPLHLPPPLSIIYSWYI